MALPAACMLVSAAAAGCAGVAPAHGHALTAQVTGPVAVRSAPGGHVIAHVGRRTEYGGRRVYRVVARHGRWLGVLSPQRPNGRKAWIGARHAVLREIPWAIRIDRSARRLIVTVGAPSSPTPLGRFAVTDKLWMEPGSVYGCCALALSGSQTRGAMAGVRLAIHGTRAPEPLGRAASNGCARATRHDLKWLMRKVALGTPVTVVR